MPLHLSSFLLSPASVPAACSCSLPLKRTSLSNTRWSDCSIAALVHNLLRSVICLNMRDESSFQSMTVHSFRPAQFRSVRIGDRCYCYLLGLWVDSIKVKVISFDHHPFSLIVCLFYLTRVYRPILLPSFSASCCFNLLLQLFPRFFVVFVSGSSFTIQIRSKIGCSPC